MPITKVDLAATVTTAVGISTKLVSSENLSLVKTMGLNSFLRTCSYFNLIIVEASLVFVVESFAGFAIEEAVTAKVRVGSAITTVTNCFEEVTCYHSGSSNFDLLIVA